MDTGRRKGATPSESGEERRSSSGREGEEGVEGGLARWGPFDEAGSQCVGTHYRERRMPLPCSVATIPPISSWALEWVG